MSPVRFATVPSLLAAVLITSVTLGQGQIASSISSQRNVDIGTGYTIASQNANTLAQGTARIPGYASSLPAGNGGGLGPYAGTAFTRPQANSSLNYNPGGAAPSSFGNFSQPASKPFENVSNGPTVSPYLNLFNGGPGVSTDFTYQTLVRPMQQQQELNQNLQRQAQAINSRVQQLASTPAYQPQGDKNQMPTGHVTTFRNTGYFFPPPKGKVPR